MKHKHYDIAAAKILNMDLILFIKPKDAPKWSESSNAYPPNSSNIDCFLCLPQHKDACLHWLNGVDLIQDSEFVIGKYSDVEASINPSFSEHGDLFMTTSRNIRMKPSKEKRWLLVNAVDDLQPQMFDDEEDANHTLQGSHPNWSKHEIDVEV